MRIEQLRINSTCANFSHFVLMGWSVRAVLYDKVSETLKYWFKNRSLIS